jgi:hypothetical protein
LTPDSPPPFVRLTEDEGEPPSWAPTYTLMVSPPETDIVPSTCPPAPPSDDSPPAPQDFTVTDVAPVGTVSVYVPAVEYVSVDPSNLNPNPTIICCIIST